MSHPSSDNRPPGEPVQHNIALAGKHVLVIEDHAVHVLVLTMILKKLSLTFEVAKDGEEGWHLFSTRNFDLVLTDIHIPGISGDRLAESIRTCQDKIKAGIPVIAVTASSDETDTEKFLEAGINAVLIKPFLFNDLKDLLEKYLL